MRRDERIRLTQQGIVRLGRFLGEYIGTESCQPTFSQRIGHSLVVHQRTATGIDKYGRRLHLLQSFLINKVSRIVCQRTVQRQHVSRAEQFLQRGFLDTNRQCISCLAGQCLHLHAEGQRNLSDTTAYVSQSYDAKSLSRQFHVWEIPIAEVRILGPASLTVLHCIVFRAIGYRQQMGKHHLCHALRAVSRNIRDNDTAFTSKCDIHHVIPRSQHANVFKVW